MTMLPTLETGLREAAARQESTRRKRPTRRVAVATVACALALAATAVGAMTDLLPLGDDAPDQAPLSSSPIGELAPGSDAVLPVHAQDPDGGPAWGLRIYRTTAGVTCLQPGRVQAGVMGIVGDDGKFHPQRPQVHDCQQGATADGLSGRAVMLSSGQIPAGICRAANESTALPSCDPTQIRTLTYGVRASHDGHSAVPYITVEPGVHDPAAADG
jgi:hypothetical protein